MRRLSILLCALLLAVVASAPQLLAAKPAHALAACKSGDLPGSPYFDHYNQAGWQVHDSFVGGNPTHWIMTDVAIYRLSGGFGVGQDGHCYRGYYASDWAGDGSGGYWHSHLRAWVCGRGPYEFDGGTVGIGAWRNDVVSYGPNWGSEGIITIAPSDGPARNRLVDFADYGDGTCRPQVDNFSMGANSPTWDNQAVYPFQAVWSASDFTPGTPYAWYCHENHLYPFDVVCGSG